VVIQEMACTIGGPHRFCLVDGNALHECGRHTPPKLRVGVEGYGDISRKNDVAKSSGCPNYGA
jgi:hypothetical protein